MVRAQMWSYLQRPRPWRECHHCFGAGGGAGGAVISSAGRASMARNRQVPQRSGSAIGVASEVIFSRNCMAPFPVASGGEQGQSSAARQQRPPKKGNNRGHRGAGRGGSSEGSGSSRSTFANSSIRRTIPGPPDRGRVERLHNELCRWTRVPPLFRRQWRRRRCRQQQRRARCLPLHRG